MAATARQGLDRCVVEDWEADLEAGGEVGVAGDKRKAGAWFPARIHGICSSWAERRRLGREEGRKEGGAASSTGARRSRATADGHGRRRDPDPAGRATPINPWVAYESGLHEEHLELD